MTVDESLPTYDFEIPLEIKNLEKKAEILQLWETAKNAFSTNDVKKVRSDLLQVTKLDDSLYGVWYNLGIAEDFAGWCFNEAIELKPDHIDSWRGKGRYHELKIRDYYGDDNFDQIIHSQNWNACQSICEEIEVMNKFKKLKFTELSEDQLATFFVDLEIVNFTSGQGANVLNLALCCLKYSMYDEVIKLLENCWENYPVFFYFLGIAYGLSGNFEKALEQYDKILNLEPENVYALLQKGSILFKNEESVDEITKIIVKNTVEETARIFTNRDGKPTVIHEKTIHVKPNPAFFEICLNDRISLNDGPTFPSNPYSLSLKNILDGFNEGMVGQLILETRQLYDYTAYDHTVLQKIEKTWNGSYLDFEI